MIWRASIVSYGTSRTVLRAKEAKNIFDAEFIALARSVYKLNDRRFEIKRRLNAETASELIEEKIYPKYP